jgi:hypothetical protein
MSELVDAIVSSDFLKLVIPAAGAIVAWFWNERRKVRLRLRRSTSRRGSCAKTLAVMNNRLHFDTW